MSINTATQFGKITISIEAVTSLAIQAASECYGVVGIGKGPFGSHDNDGNSGVEVHLSNRNFQVNLYLYLAYGVRITEVISEVQKKVKYVLESSFGVPFKAINVFVEDVKEV